MTDSHVLDASAILCLVRAEPGAGVVEAALPGSAVSAVNLAEVVAKMVDLGMDGGLIDQVLGPLNLRVVPFDAAQGRASGLMRASTRDLGLSLGDRACLALAEELGAVALTTDQAWAALAPGVAVTLVR